MEMMTTSITLRQNTGNGGNFKLSVSFIIGGAVFDFIETF